MRDLTFYGLTSMNIVNTVDLHCHVATLKMTEKATTPWASMWHEIAEDEKMTTAIKGY